MSTVMRIENKRSALEWKMFNSLVITYFTLRSLSAVKRLEQAQAFLQNFRYDTASSHETKCLPCTNFSMQNSANGIA